MTNTRQRRIVLTEEQGRAVAPGLRHVSSAAQNPPMSQRAIDIPRQTCPCQFSELGAMVAVRCPHDYDSVMLKAGGLWEPGSRRWLIERRRIVPVIRALRSRTDTLFRAVGLDLASAATRVD